MKKFRKLRYVVAGALLLLAAGPLRPAFAWFDSTYLETASMVAVSTTPTLPTTILAATAGGANVKLMLNWSGSGTYPNSEYLLISSNSTGISTQATNGTIRIPAGQRPSDFIDLGDYKGPIYGVVLGTTSAQNVSVLRKK